MLLLVRHCGSPRAHAGTTAMCMWAREMERAQVVPSHVWAREASGAGWVLGEGAACGRYRCGSIV
jgi:hypothetical protein